MILARGLESQLREDRSHVALDRLELEGEPLGDRGIRAALGHQREDLALTRRQLVERRVAARAAEQARHDLRVDHRAAGGDASHSVGQVVEPGDAFLEQVADPGRVLTDEVDRVARLDVLRQHEDRHLGLCLTNLAGGLQALRRVRGRHPHVDDRHVRPLPGDEREQPGHVLGLADDLGSPTPRAPPPAPRGAGPRRRQERSGSS